MFSRSSLSQAQNELYIEQWLEQKKISESTKMMMRGVAASLTKGQKMSKDQTMDSLYAILKEVSEIANQDLLTHVIRINNQKKMCRGSESPDERIGREITVSQDVELELHDAAEKSLVEEDKLNNPVHRSLAVAGTASRPALSGIRRIASCLCIQELQGL